MKELDCWWTKKKSNLPDSPDYLLRWEVRKKREGSKLRNHVGPVRWAQRDGGQAGRHKSGLRGLGAGDSCDRRPLVLSDARQRKEA